MTWPTIKRTAPVGGTTGKAVCPFCGAEAEVARDTFLTSCGHAWKAEAGEVIFRFIEWAHVKVIHKEGSHDESAN